MGVYNVIGVKVAANSTGLNVGLSAAARSIESFRGNVLSTLSKIGAGFAAVAGAGSFASLLKGSAESIDELSKLSDLIGFSTEQLAGLAYQGKLAGVEFEELSLDLRGLSRRLGDAMRGTGEAAKAIEDLKLDAAELVKMPLPQALGRIADQFEKIRSPGLRASIATDLFGRSGDRMALVLAGGSKAMAEAVTMADKLGLTFDRARGSGVEKMNDAVTTLGLAFKGLANQIVTTVSGAGTSLVDWLTNAIIKMREMRISTEGWGLSFKLAMATMRGAITSAYPVLSRLVGFPMGARAAQAVFPAQTAQTSGGDLGPNPLGYPSLKPPIEYLDDAKMVESTLAQRDAMRSFGARAGYALRDLGQKLRIGLFRAFGLGVNQLPIAALPGGTSSFLNPAQFLGGAGGAGGGQSRQIAAAERSARELETIRRILDRIDRGGGLAP